MRWGGWYFWYQTFRSCGDTARLGRFSHMDEVGFMVRNQARYGTFRVVEIGGWTHFGVSTTFQTLETRDGHESPVISGSVPAFDSWKEGGPTVPHCRYRF